MLELTVHGDSSRVDMLVGDIYGGRDYSSIGLSADTIASSFGKVVMEGGTLEVCTILNWLTILERLDCMSMEKE